MATSTSSGPVYAPLTTLWARPAACQLTLAVSESGHINATFESTCYPPTPSSFVIATESVGTYSPGLCPNGFSTAAASPFPSPTTTGICCTLSYTYDASKKRCARTITTPTSVVSVGLAGGTSTIAVSSLTALDSAIYVIFQPTDIPLLSSANASHWLVDPDATATTSLATTVLPDPLVPTLPTEGEKPGGTNELSKGAQAGIGVGIAAGALILLSVGVWLWRRRRRHAGKGEVLELGGDGTRASEMLLEGMPGAFRAERKSVGGDEPELSTHRPGALAGAPPGHGNLDSIRGDPHHGGAAGGEITTTARSEGEVHGIGASTHDSHSGRVDHRVT